ncbi:MAG: hypothetical protein ACUVX9_00390 [Anaerolineae bacterium]
MSRDEAGRNIRKAMEMPIQGLTEDNLPVPAPGSSAEYITLA